MAKKELTLIEQYILLTVLQLKNKANLINIRDRINEISGKESAIGTIYVPLERLDRLGYLHSNLVKPAPKAGGRSVRYYSLTQSGFQALSSIKSVQDRLWKGFSGAFPKNSG